MFRYVLSVISVGLLFLLVGCRAGTILPSSSTFSPFAPQANLAQSVQDALSKSEDPVIAQLHAEMNQNTVVLSGYVKKIRQSDTAEQIAHQVPGVQAIENRIIVRQ